MRGWRPLRGIRVVAFETAVALPAGTRFLADLGAEVVEVRRPERLWSPLVDTYDGTLLNKASVALDLTHEEGLAVAKRLVASADVVCNNFRPRVMRSYGLDYESLRALKPDIIVLELSGYGSPGPWEDIPAFGPSVEAAGGINALLGDDADHPARVGSGVYADQLAGRYAALAVLGALAHRQRTGEGQYMDLSMYESMIRQIGDVVMSTAAHEGAFRRWGNRDAAYAPQGIYPSRGQDEWVAVSVTTDEEWRSLRALLDDARLDDAALDGVEGRREAHDVLDEVIAAWTRERTKDEAACLLQERGIPAGPVQKPCDVPFDPQHAHRRYFGRVVHREPVLGYRDHPHTTQAPLVTGRARPRLTDAHDDGYDTRRVLRSWLRMSLDEVRGLERRGALLPRRALISRQGPVAYDGFGEHDPEFERRLGLTPAGEA
jgi:crotonobetainyl-CoA:carnitine CoA-transferase CaiB-like acyl-CoA transferase